MFPQDEVPEPSPSQYQHEKLKRMLESLTRDSPSAEEFDEDEEGDRNVFLTLR